MIQEKTELYWSEPRDYPMPSGEGRVVKEQSPPCPNGCGNEEVHRAEKPRDRRKEMGRSSRTHAGVHFFFCEHCMSFFQIKIEGAQKDKAPASVSSN
ncbi:MAG TPA: hypothetical protein VL688_02765 [Verrucomicrobiae bacterium]|jgi:hypothetical protein|nr:hypothetical protein [Verrucomicrobiae bacterium]